jgi:hypothetical protein
MGAGMIRTALGTFWAQFRDVLALLADLLGVLVALNVWPTVPSIIVLLSALAFFVLGLVWGIMGTLSRQWGFLRALAITAIVLSTLGLLYVLPVLVVRLFDERPPEIGTLSKERDTTCTIVAVTGPEQLSGSCELDFEMSADSAEVTFAVVGPDRERVKDLSVTPEPDTEAGDLQTNDPKEAGVRILNPSPSRHVTAKLLAILEPGKKADPVTVRVLYRYREKDNLWRVRRWVFQRYP